MRAQQRTMPPWGWPGIGKRAEPLRDRAGLGLCALLRTAAGNKERLTTRGVRHQRVLAAVARLKIQKALHQAAVIAVEDACHVTQHLVMAAEVAHEFDELAGGASVVATVSDAAVEPTLRSWRRNTSTSAPRKR